MTATAPTGLDIETVAQYRFTTLQKLLAVPLAAIVSIFILAAALLFGAYLISEITQSTGWRTWSDVVSEYIFFVRFASIFFLPFALLLTVPLSLATLEVMESRERTDFAGAMRTGAESAGIVAAVFAPFILVGTLFANIANADIVFQEWLSTTALRDTTLYLLNAVLYVFSFIGTGAATGLLARLTTGRPRALVQDKQD